MARGSLALALLASVAATAMVLVRWRSDRIGVVELRGLSLRDQTLPQFTQDEGEMKADDNIFSSEGQSAPKPVQDWTGHGGAAFNYLQKEASSPVEEAEDAVSETLRRATPHTSRYDLYGSWGSSGSRRDTNRFSDNLRRMREAEAERRHQQDRSFFKGVQQAFGKKEGKYLEKEFDPSLKVKKKPHHSAPLPPSKYQHPGVIASASRIKALVQSLKHAHGAKKSEVQHKLKDLQAEIANDYSKVTAFGHSAETKLKRAMAAKKAKADADSSSR
mmetsp:Transcript_47705/g.112590  ORF Transcript_47705/g.112590 Transcript_47705/m.112590 type:complete len:274 (-) Transcript_47705:273-1094(-)